MVKLNKIYTRTGDDGTTGLVDGSRNPKDAPRMVAIGSVDEANSLIGLARVAIGAGDVGDGGDFDGALARIQNDLFDLGADIATPAPVDADFAPSEMVLRIVPAQVEWLEARIDALTAQLTPLTSFILPGGNEGAARVHLARAVVRRAERDLVHAARDVAINPQALAYLNRLSDYLFVLGRGLNGGGTHDVLWVPGQSRQTG